MKGALNCEPGQDSNERGRFAFRGWAACWPTVRPRLLAASTNAYVRGAVQAAFAAACEAGRAQVAGMLLESGAIAVAVAQEAFVAACDGDRAEVAAVLLAVDGVDGNALSSDGDPVFVAAVRRGSAPVIQVLGASGKCDTSCLGSLGERDGALMLHYAVYCDQADSVRALLGLDGFAVNERTTDWERTALMQAAERSGNGAALCVAALLEDDGVDVNARDVFGFTALSMASRWCNTASVQVLLAADGVDFNGDESPEARAGKCGEFGPGGSMPLLQACEFEDNSRITDADRLACIQALAGVDGINVNQADHVGRTPLHVVVQNGASNRPAMIRALLAAKGADVNCAGREGYSALHTAMCHDEEQPDYDSVFALIAARGIDMNQRHGNGGTLLHMACELRDTDLVAAFLLAGSCRFMRDGNNQLPMARAHRDVDHEDAKWLAFLNADVVRGAAASTNAPPDWRPAWRRAAGSKHTRAFAKRPCAHTPPG